jgi:hypothetical protein
MIDIRELRKTKTLLNGYNLNNKNNILAPNIKEIKFRK